MARVTGSAKYRGQELIGLPLKGLNEVRGAKITMIFQEPMTSLDPLYTIGRQIAEPIVHHKGVTLQTGARCACSNCSSSSAFPNPNAASTAIRMKCPAASASAS